ncbi:MAG: serine dehydratase beta chain, partial [Propionibacteriaceae bacterium]|nr:serine dehydratase beta chain [Propionibacteriaceae bacterium]
MTISALEIFKIGIGPSSSHTMGPMRAGCTFVTELGERIGDTAKVRVDLFGSLAATGVGHGTDRAAVGGLLGYSPEDCDPDEYSNALDQVTATGRLRLNGRQEVPFTWADDLTFNLQSKPLHPNAMTITATDVSGTEVHENTYYSIGGGFIIDQAQAESGQRGVEAAAVEFPFGTAAELLAICDQEGLSIAQVVARNELAWRSADELRDGLRQVWAVMCGCIERGLRQEGILPGGLRVPRRAPELFRHLNSRDAVPNLITQTFSAMDWVNLYALAVNEENA